MRKMIVSGIGAAAALAFSFVSLGCEATDVVARVAKSSFDAVIAASGTRVFRSDDGKAWILASPAGDELSFAADFSTATKGGAPGGSGTPDVGFSFDAAPFLAAGLDATRLARAGGIAYVLEGSRLTIGFELGGDVFPPSASGGLEATFAEIVRTQRSRIGYHEKLDHYGIKLGDGTMFEWAKDMSANDKDIVWVLNPEPFIAAGVDPEKVEGWIFAKVEMKDDAGATVFVDKLLRPFDLR